MAPRLSVDEEQAILRGINAEADNLNKIRLNAQKATAERVSTLYRQYPMLQPGVLLALAKNNTPETVVAQIARETALAANENPEKMNGEKDGNWLSDAFKQTTRLGFAVANSSNELVQNAVATAKNAFTTVKNIPGETIESALSKQVAGGGKSPSPLPDSESLKIVSNAAPVGGMSEGFLGSTTLATLIDNWNKQGTGYFVGSEITGEQAARARSFRGVTNGGHAWTIGRGMAGVAFEEGGTAYNFLSGVVDGYVAVKIPVAPGLSAAGSKISELAEAPTAGKALVKAGAIADTLQGRGVQIKVSDLTGDELREAHRLAGIVGGAVDPVEANKFLGSKGGRRLVARLVDANTVDDVRNVVGKKVYLDTVQKLRDAKTELDVQAVLADVLGLPSKGLTSTVGVKGTKALMLSNARRTALLNAADNIPGAKKVARGLSGRAGDIGDISSEAPRDVRATIDNIDNWAKIVLLPEESWSVTKTLKDGTKKVVQLPGRRQILDMATDALTGDTATPTARRAFKELWEQVVPESMIANNVDENIVKAIFQDFYERVPKMSEWAKGVDGKPDDAGFYNGANIGDDTIIDGVFGGPMLQSELANVIINMPDPKQVAALTNNLNFLWRKGGLQGYGATGVSKALRDIKRGGFLDENIEALAKAGKLRMPVSAAIWTQDQIFRKVILFTGGYSVRNLAEAQARIALSYRDVKGIMRHPMDWLGWATHKKGGYDIVGEKFAWREGLDGTTESMVDYRTALQSERYREYGDPTVLVRRGKRSGNFQTVTRADKREIVVQAHGDEIGFLNTDPVARKIASLGTSPSAEDEVVDFIRNTPEGQKWFRDEQDYHINGRPVYDKTTGKYLPPQSIDLNDEKNLRLFIQEISNRINLQTGNDSRLMGIVSSGKLPSEKLAGASNFGVTIDDVGQEIRLGSGAKSKQVNRARVVSYDPATDEAVIQYFAFEAGESTKKLRELLSNDDVFYNPNYPEYLRWESRVELNRMETSKMGWDDTTNKAFAWLYGKPARFLDRSPLFRQFYYEMAIDRLLTSLDEAGVARLYDNIVSSAAKLKTTPQKFLDNPQRWQKIVDAKEGKLGLKGTLSLEEVDAFAKGDALDSLKQLLYDTSNSGNYLDSARVVFPFAPAWAEFFKSIGKAYTIPTASGMRLPNPRALRKTQLLVEGGREADPDGDGRGYFYVDPETGEWSMKYPGSGILGKALTNLNVGLSAPISGALQGVDLDQSTAFGLKLNPGVGPWVSVGASILIPDTPTFDSFTKFLLPYGKNVSESQEGGLGGTIASPFIPSWAKKVWSVLEDDPEQINVKGNAVFEVMQVLLQSGAYDVNDPKQMEKVFRDAQDKSTTLVWMRAIGQFLGPSRPNLEFQTKALEGDVYVNQAAADLRMWQQEDYDTATMKFFDIYGENFWPYLARKTVTEGFEALGVSPEFGKWERENESFLRANPLSAGYFAPTGTKLEWQVYTRQISQGRRRRQTNKDAFDEAQWFSANAQYRYKQKQLEEQYRTKDLPDSAQAILDKVKNELKKQYPGYREGTFEVGKLGKQISQLESSAFDKRMDNNRVAQATRYYLEARTKRVEKAQKNNGQGLKAKANKKLAGELRQVAANIIEEYPEFEVLYERVLSQEID